METAQQPQWRCCRHWRSKAKVTGVHVLYANGLMNISRRECGLLVSRVSAPSLHRRRLLLALCISWRIGRGREMLLVAATTRADLKVTTAWPFDGHSHCRLSFSWFRANKSFVINSIQWRRLIHSPTNQTDSVFCFSNGTIRPLIKDETQTDKKTR